MKLHQTLQAIKVIRLEIYVIAISIEFQRELFSLFDTVKFPFYCVFRDKNLWQTCKPIVLRKLSQFFISARPVQKSQQFKSKSIFVAFQSIQLSMKFPKNVFDIHF